MNNKNTGLRSVVSLLAMAVCAILPIYNMVIKGVYHWHITQPETYQGFIVIAIVAVMMIAALLFLKDSMLRKLSILLPVVAYSSINGIIIPLFAGWIFMEMIVFLGSLLQKEDEYAELSVVKQFIAGFCIWGTTTIIASALGIGTISKLRIIFVLLFVLAIVLRGKQPYSSVAERVYRAVYEKPENTGVLIDYTLLLCLGLYLMAKSNRALDYDSLWYGLRPEYVLFGDHSFFDNLGYSCFVYYYPKGLELLLSAVSGLGDYSFILIGNVFVSSMLVFLLVHFFKYVCKLDASIYTKLVLMVVSIPSIANYCVTAKADNLAAILIFYSFICINKTLKEQNTVYALESLLALLLATGTRVSAYVWIFLMGVLLILCLIRVVMKGNCVLRLTASDVCRYILGCIFVAGMHLRTFLLTGYLLYPSFKPIQQMFGFHARYPFTDTERDITDGVHPDASPLGILKKLYMIFFDPQELIHVIMAWTSTVILLLLILLLLYRKRSKTYPMRGLMIGTISLFLSVFLLLYTVILGKPDGNYFTASIVVLIAAMIYILAHCPDFNAFSRSGFFKLGICLLILSQFIMTAVSHPSWSWGTERFSGEIIADNFSTQAMNRAVFQAEGIENIADYIEANLQNRRVISVGAEWEGTVFMIQGRIETTHEFCLVGMPFFNENIMESYRTFRQYMESIDLGGIILFHGYEGIDREYMERYVQEKNMRLVIEDHSASLWVC